MTQPRDVLVLMPCGGEKLDTRARALDLYTGPMWQTLRTHLGVIPERNVFVLSAEHGLVSGLRQLEPYDRKMTAPRARMFRELAIDVGRAHRAAGHITNHPSVVQAVARWSYGRAELDPWQVVIVAGAGLYQEVLLHYVEQLQARGIIDPEAELVLTAGNGAGIGTQRSLLGKALARFQPQPLQERGEQVRAPELAREMVERLSSEVLITAELHGQDAVVVRQMNSGGLVASFWETAEAALDFAEAMATLEPTIVLAKKPRQSGKDAWPLRAWRNIAQG